MLVVMTTSSSEQIRSVGGSVCGSSLENSSKYFLMVAMPSVVEMLVYIEVASVVTILALFGSFGVLSRIFRRSVLFLM